MIKIYVSEFQVLASNSNSTEGMGVSDILNEFQDATTAHAEILHVDGRTMRDKSNAFWVILKNKIRIYRTPKFLDRLKISTWPNYPGPVRSNRNFIIEDEAGNILVEGRSEWVLLDMDDRTVRRFSTTVYPVEFEHYDAVILPGPFLRMRESIDDTHFIYSKKVMFSDIDIAGHTNNVVYVKLLMNAFDCKFFTSNEVTDFEIDYRHESHEGEMINIYKKETEDGYYLQASDPDGRIFACAVMKTRKI